jgi:tol-pal system protein YbgF
MIHLRLPAAPIMVFLIAAGCASQAGRMPRDAAMREKPEESLQGALERIDRNSTEIRAMQSDLRALRLKVENLETGMRAAVAAESAQIQEIKENISFLSDQVLRLDSSVRSGAKSPREREPESADVFKPDGFNVESAYKEAFADYQARRYEVAIGKFNEIITVASSSSLADNAQYWIGECWYALRNYERSLQAFQRVFTFPKTNKAADARLKIGFIYLQMNNRDAAREEMKMVIEQYPSSDAAKIAAAKLKELKEE